MPQGEKEKEEFVNIVKNHSRDFSKELNFNEAFNNVFKCFKKVELRDSVEEIFNDPKINDFTEKSNFWLLCAALHRFHTIHGLLPVSGILPDMTSTTDFYLAL